MFPKHTSVYNLGLVSGAATGMVQNPPPVTSRSANCCTSPNIFPKFPLFQNHDWDPGGRAQHVLSHPLSPSLLQPRPRLLLLHPHLRPQQPQLQVELLKRGLQLVELSAEAPACPRLSERAAEKEGRMVRKPLQLRSSRHSWVPNAGLVQCSWTSYPPSFSQVSQ